MDSAPPRKNKEEETTNKRGRNSHEETEESGTTPKEETEREGKYQHKNGGKGTSTKEREGQPQEKEWRGRPLQKNYEREEEPPQRERGRITSFLSFAGGCSFSSPSFFLVVAAIVSSFSFSYVVVSLAFPPLQN